LDCIVHHLVLGGRPAANFAKRLMLPVSNDTLLRVVRRHGQLARMEPQNVAMLLFEFKHDNLVW